MVERSINGCAATPAMIDENIDGHDLNLDAEGR